MNKDPPSSNRCLRMVQLAINMANDNRYGYSQKPPSGRWGPDFDCSSFIYYIADRSGYPVGTGKDKVRFTGTMLKDFEKAGFQILPFANVGISDLKIGDILLNLALHAEVYVGNGESVGALSSETGGYVGEEGDQTDHEIEKHPVITFNKEWDYVLRPPDDDDDEIEEEGENEMPMNYGPNAMMPTQPWNNPGQPWMGNSGYSQGMGPGNMQGYQQGYGMNNRMMPNQGGMNGNMQGYPQGNLGQMNGYSQANAGGYPNNGGQQTGYQQGYPQGMGEKDLCYVMGIEGAKNLIGMPNSRKAVFDEDKAIMYVVSFDAQGMVNNIRCFNFEECSEDMPQHLSPLMRDNQNGSMGMGMNAPMGDFITRAEFEELKEMMSNDSSTKQSNRPNGSNGGRNGNQQSGSKLNARTN